MRTRIGGNVAATVLFFIGLSISTPYADIIATCTDDLAVGEFQDCTFGGEPDATGMVEKEFIDIGSLFLDVNQIDDLTLSTDVTETIVNPTAPTWTDYHLELSGVGDPVFNSISQQGPFGMVSGIGTTVLTLFDGTLLGGGGQMQLVFSIAIGTPTAGGVFTLEQFPTIDQVGPAAPEPTTLVLLGLGLLGLRLSKRRGLAHAA